MARGTFVASGGCQKTTVAIIIDGVTSRGKSIKNSWKGKKER
jgi:hypothetical protein